jgi:TetR/AcrR family transcriptional repressor of lmrAB and yxaGH operons
MARTIAERSDVIPVLAEIFRGYGFEGASLARISADTGLGKGSLYHFFPGGKEEMARTVLDHIDAWFECHIFKPLLKEEDAAHGIARMLNDVESYFAEGRRVCLLGLFALSNERDRFSEQVDDYFSRWQAALAHALERAGHAPTQAQQLAEHGLVAIQGALVLARARHEPALFGRAIERLRTELRAPALA